MVPLTEKKKAHDSRLDSQKTLDWRLVHLWLGIRSGQSSGKLSSVPMSREEWAPCSGTRLRLQWKNWSRL